VSTSGGLASVPRRGQRRGSRAAAPAATLTASSVSLGHETVEESGPAAWPGRLHGHLAASSRAESGPVAYLIFF
jgi:hypothetical protein